MSERFNPIDPKSTAGFVGRTPEQMDALNKAASGYRALLNRGPAPMFPEGHSFPSGNELGQSVQPEGGTPEQDQNNG